MSEINEAKKRNLMNIGFSEIEVDELQKSLAAIAVPKKIKRKVILPKVAKKEGGKK